MGKAHFIIHKFTTAIPIDLPIILKFDGPFLTPSQCSFFKMLRYGTGEKAAQNEKWKNVL